MYERNKNLLVKIIQCILCAISNNPQITVSRYSRGLFLPYTIVQHERILFNTQGFIHLVAVLSLGLQVLFIEARG